MYTISSQMGGAKKMWPDDGAKGAGDASAKGGIFPGPWSREDGWNQQQHHPGISSNRRECLKFVA